jgi:sugar diacid utilization regulator
VAARFVRLGYPLAADRRHLVVALGGAVGSSSPRGLPRRGARFTVGRPARWRGRADYRHLSPLSSGVLLLATRRSASDRRADGCASLLKARPEACCSAGVSRLVDGIPGLREAVSQAISAWDLGQCIANRAAPYYYEELGLYRLLASLRERDELRRFYEETLGDLVRYDQEHDAELVHTLDVFFAENANVSQASRALYVHRNTLNYRLQRVVDISGLDLNDPETRLALQLALKVYHLSQGQLDG